MSLIGTHYPSPCNCFNPRPPKRTLCLAVDPCLANLQTCFNPRPPKRTLCHSTKSFKAFHTSLFQSTSSEEDVVSTCGVAQTEWIEFQSTSSEEDVVSFYHRHVYIFRLCFNPRPPKRTLCLWLHGDVDIENVKVSIHVLRRGRCVLFTGLPFMSLTMFQSTSSEEDVVSQTRLLFYHHLGCFNPRPPKRTLCLNADGEIEVELNSFNPRPPKRTLCHIVAGAV